MSHCRFPHPDSGGKVLADARKNFPCAVERLGDVRANVARPNALIEFGLVHRASRLPLWRRRGSLRLRPVPLDEIGEFFERLHGPVASMARSCS